MLDNIKHVLTNDGAELPIYTILVPLYQEAVILNQLVQSLLALDYPHNKLDIIFCNSSQVNGLRQERQNGSAHKLY